ncbi:serine hydrolase domain-containing protein [Cytophagaceae bacterium DM2B3-1]|uniref:Serine hydrolase domain-containing protein n=1 Tax=Xanthocytophaga flava TaxID=3048013 RepID=A0ABT7CUT1_9BACT|nr:serine hydrolase domain-containing protein [Xanthocytophaga flavus]MDJ1467078.1 serine hydrolase domain-containing protein [Xanthocytophaga flavus]MDJ1497426.1 serine hydrolase domain-containing protein [Xanthocytophaga flavus]
MKLYPSLLLFFVTYISWSQVLHSKDAIMDKQAKNAIRKAEKYIDSLQAKQDIPGISICIGNRERILWAQGFGYADLENVIGVTTKSRFRIGSVSKALTSLAMAKLFQQGKLDLDVSIQRYTTVFPEKKYPVTARQLATHTAGIRHYRATDPINCPKRYEKVTDGLVIFKDDSLLFKPGTGYSYSSYGYNLLSVVIEGASKTDFITYMMQEVFTPLGLKSTMADYSDSIVANRVRFYEHSDKKLINAPMVDNSYKWAGGGFLSTPSDLVTMATKVLNGQFLDKKTVDMVFTSQKLLDGKDTQYGMGWRMGTDSKGRHVIHHGGVVEGGRTFVLLYPDQGIYLAITANMSGVSINLKEGEAIASYFLE